MHNKGWLHNEIRVNKIYNVYRISIVCYDVDNSVCWLTEWCVPPLPRASLALRPWRPGRAACPRSPSYPPTQPIACAVDTKVVDKVNCCISGMY